ncbi:MAG: hypothetical protein RIQ81_2214 [Pseudomonadota bacterium]|jgi:hypothetical protein
MSGRVRAREIVVLVTAVVTMGVLLAACGSSVGDFARTIGLSKERKQKHASPDPVDPALMALTAQSVTSDASHQAYDHCSQILAKGVFNTRRVEDDYLATARQRRFLCAQTESALEEIFFDYMSDKSKRTSAASGKGKSGMDLVIDSLPVGFTIEGEGQSSGSQDKEYTRETAKAHASNFKAQHCSESDESNQVEKTYDLLEQIADENIVDAWKACISKNQGGFFCHAEDNDGHVLLNLKWEPSDLAREVLPVVQLNWQTTENLELASRSLPVQLGAGSGTPVAFRRVKEDQVSALQVSATDAQGQVSFSCSRKIPAVRKGSMIEDRRCGPALFREQVVEVKKGRGPQCGVQAFSEARSSVCGVERYRSGPDMSCPGSSAAHQYKKAFETTCGGSVETYHTACNSPADRQLEVRSSTSPCVVTEMVEKCVLGICRRVEVPAVKTRHDGSVLCEMPAVPGVCELPALGVEAWKSCRHESHGIELYAECRHKDFGEIRERRPEFGVEKYNSCFIYFDER